LPTAVAALGYRTLAAYLVVHLLMVPGLGVPAPVAVAWRGRHGAPLAFRPCRQPLLRFASVAALLRTNRP